MWFYMVVNVHREERCCYLPTSMNTSTSSQNLPNSHSHPKTLIKLDNGILRKYQVSPKTSYIIKDNYGLSFETQIGDCSIIAIIGYEELNAYNQYQNRNFLIKKLWFMDILNHLFYSVMFYDWYYLRSLLRIINKSCGECF